MDFLQRLAAGALGETTPLRPALPSRYETSSSARFDAVTDETAAADRVAQAGAAAPTAAAHRTSPAPAPSPSGHADRGTTHSAPRDVAVHLAVPRAVERSPATPETTARRDPVALAEDRAVPSPIELPAASPARAERSVRPSARVHDLTLPTPAALRGHAPNAPALPPLAAAAVASQPDRRSASNPPGGPTVVHVSIDRIDVRAPAALPSRKGNKAPARATEARSLADYLRGSGR
jgi:hypothetical protein